jgi:hypothetical protein
MSSASMCAALRAISTSPCSLFLGILRRPAVLAGTVGSEAQQRPLYAVALGGPAWAIRKHVADVVLTFSAEDFMPDLRSRPCVSDLDRCCRERVGEVRPAAGPELELSVGAK